MNQSFYIAAVGAQQYQQRLNVQGNNIANVNTYGFKASDGRFAALMREDVRAIEENPAVTSGLGGAMRNTATDFVQGAYAETGYKTDYAIAGDGFFALADLATGEISLTRDGSFTMASLQRDSGEVDEAGEAIMEEIYYLSDGDGRFVLSRTGGMIELENAAAAEEKLPVGIFDYMNYDGMIHVDGTRFLAVEKNGGLRMGTGELLQGMLETSNADLAEELTKVIESQRAYSMALKMVQTSDEIESTINSLRK